MNDRPIPESGYNARRGCVLIGTGLFAILVIWAVVMAHLFVVANRPPNIRIPTHSLPTPNAYDDWEAAGKLMRGLRPMGPLSDTRPIKSWTLPELKEFADANQPVFELFRQGLGKPYKHPPLRGWDGVRIYAAYREIARRVTGEALYYKALGEPGRAARCCLNVVEMGVRLPDGGNGMTALSGQAVEAIGLSQMVPLLPGLSQEELLSVQTRLESIQTMRVPLSEIILEEGRSTVSLWEETFRDPSFVRSLSDLSAWSDPSVTAWTGREAWRRVAVALRNKQALLEDMLSYYKKAAHELMGPVYTGPPRAKPPEPGISWTGIEQVPRLAAALATSPPALELLRTDCALRRYHMDHGRYPESLAQLAPRFVKSVPLDPCGGKPLNYRPLKGGRDFLLYSIGPNLKDDGGLAGKWRDPDAKSDIVEGRWHE